MNILNLQAIKIGDMLISKVLVHLPCLLDPAAEYRITKVHLPLAHHEKDGNLCSHNITVFICVLNVESVVTKLRECS